MADGALNEVHDILKRMNELSIQAANGTLTNEDRAQIQGEIDALVSEIDRIGDDTTFNEHQIFDGREAGMVDNGSIADLIRSPSAEKHYLLEAYYNTNDSQYYPMGSLDFSNINATNLNYLHNGSFSFNCSQYCSEVFNIKFTTDGSANSATNLSGKTTHHYSVDLSGCTSGTDIVHIIYTYISQKLPDTAPSGGNFPGVGVSHSNNLVKDGDKLLVVANSGGFTTEANAKNKFASSVGTSNRSGRIECTALKVPKPAALVKNFTIQCSSDKNDIEKIQICQMNTKVLNLEQLNVSTQQSAQNAMTKVQDANDTISRHRSILGAMQNRLEHAYGINEISSENTSSAESKIRDTNMANEVVAYSMQNILAKLGESMMAQANQSKQGILQLLQ